MKEGIIKILDEAVLYGYNNSEITVKLLDLYDVSKRDNLINELEAKKVKIELTDKNISDIKESNERLTEISRDKTMLKIK